ESPFVIERVTSKPPPKGRKLTVARPPSRGRLDDSLFPKRLEPRDDVGMNVLLARNAESYLVEAASSKLLRSYLEEVAQDRVFESYHAPAVQQQEMHSQPLSRTKMRVSVIFGPRDPPDCVGIFIAEQPEHCRVRIPIDQVRVP